MTSVKELNESFESLSLKVLKVKRDRDTLLEACKIALPFLYDCVRRPPNSFSTARVGSDAEDSLKAMETAIKQAESDS